ncbi:Malonyl CoA-acyl carrier protein transacylase (MCT) [Candidatus Methylomirabilis oxygeniifera]|uniref:Malonyl CoA-acyl carrier protein transacylase n=1 Tax=Methylomirabilis oxygeniifera TaxID=671143 RepID=D5MFG5_METO1|nr:Malonyl CoA-acyl carrier protein transacylase (MCT) [Candidatus Methylomirabilis oxyfera]
MGQDFWSQIPEARILFEKASEALGIDLGHLCFKGPEEQLTLTANAQPAIMTVSMAAVAALQREGIKPDYVAGHSLGEYSALVASGSLAFEDAIRIVRKRGEFMQEAVAPGAGAMAAILGLDRQSVYAICEEAAQYGIVEVANLNGPGQVVIAGKTGAVDRAVELAKQRGAKRAVRLQVSAPFHCSLMEPAAQRLAGVLQATPIADPTVPLVNNADAELLTTRDAVADSLVRQVTRPVRWEDVVRRLVKEGVTIFLELGPGKVLTGLIRRIAPEATALYAEDPGSLRLAVDQLEAVR